MLHTIIRLKLLTVQTKNHEEFFVVLKKESVDVYIYDIYG